jgi:ribosome maturation factor RimP
MEQIDKIRSILETKFKDEGYTDLFVVELKYTQRYNKLEVFLDSDTHVDFDRCTRLNRMLQQVLDENLWLGDRYTLDVSSAGIGKPLLFVRQYKKNVNRQIEVTTQDDKVLDGILFAADDNEITIEQEVKVEVPGKKKKELQLVKTTLPYTQIKNAAIKVTF